MGMVFQHFALAAASHRARECRLSAREIQGVARGGARGSAPRRVIDLVGLARAASMPSPRELSGGQQQRVGIARSLAVEPELWFLDEPFSALDPLIRREMQDRSSCACKRVLRKTIVFITHDFDEAIRLADRIAIMKDGEIVQSGARRRSSCSTRRPPMWRSSPASVEPAPRSSRSAHSLMRASAAVRGQQAGEVRRQGAGGRSRRR
jgi:ABC-type proline/glycine betaine transport system ATPase subunit